MCRTRCRLNAMYIDTEPVNIVPVATKRPSSRTASEDKLSLIFTELTSEPFSGVHS